MAGNPNLVEVSDKFDASMIRMPVGYYGFQLRYVLRDPSCLIFGERLGRGSSTRRPIQNWSRKADQIRPSRLRRAMLSSGTPRIVFGRKGLNWPLLMATTPSPRPCKILRISKRSRRPIRLLRSMTSSPSHGCQNRNVEGRDNVPYRRGGA